MHNITIKDLYFRTIIGILPKERICPQKIVLNINFSYIYTSSNFIDYSKVVNELKNNFRDSKYLLLEDAIDIEGDKILNKYENIKELYFSIEKPDIIKNVKVSLSKSWRRD